MFTLLSQKAIQELGRVDLVISWKYWYLSSQLLYSYSVVPCLYVWESLELVIVSARPHLIAKKNQGMWFLPGSSTVSS